MPETAPAQVSRLVHLIAWMSQRDSDGPVTYHAAAARLGVSEKTVRDDLEALVRVSEDYKPWLASLSVAFTKDGFALGSRGPFRRPFRLTPDETLALILGLAGVRGGENLASRLGNAFAKTPAAPRAAASIGLGPSPSAHVEEVLGLAREAWDRSRKLAINYCGSGGEPGRRVVQVHQIVQRQMWWYLIAWCEDVGAMRHFRADRVLDARLLDEPFVRRAEFVPVTRVEEVFRAEETIPATVAFSPRIARWLKEKYPGGREEKDGRYLVTLPVADPAWFVREVLQYGA
ncbi:MAG TPA: WYL domain-containing protein, partial [Gemmatimonadales bacterium]